MLKRRSGIGCFHCARAPKYLPRFIVTIGTHMDVNSLNVDFTLQLTAELPLPKDANDGFRHAPSKEVTTPPNEQTGMRYIWLRTCVATSYYTYMWVIT